jgi:hypothetical protein
VLRPAGKVVYVIAEVDGQKKAQQKPVKTGAKRGGRIEILEGLAGGETIALDGAGFLTNGAAVAIKEAAAGKVPAGTQSAGAGGTAITGKSAGGPPPPPPPPPAGKSAAPSPNPSPARGEGSVESR